MNLNSQSVSHTRMISDFIQQEAFTAENPVTAPAIAEKFKLHPSHVRGCINLARSMGIPICSNAKGYWYSSDSEEIQRTIEHIEERITKQKAAVTGMRATLGK